MAAILALAALSSAGLAPGAVYAADQGSNWPNKPITLIIPFAVGGVSDVVFRALAKEMSIVLGVPVVVDSKSGAGGTVGAAYVAAAPADGYTLLQTNPAVVGVAPRLMKKISYDPIKSFTPIATVITTGHLLVVNKETPIYSLADIAPYIKAHPGAGLSFASAGQGSVGHLAGQVLQNTMGIQMTHVPYKSSALAFPDVIAGRVAMVFDAVPSSIRFVSSGQLRPIAITSKARNPLLPDVPTVAEAGYPASTMNFWMGLEGPAGIPAPIVEKLNQAVQKSLASKEMQQTLLTIGAEAFVSTPQQFDELRKSDSVSLGKVVNELNIMVD